MAALTPLLLCRHCGAVADGDPRPLHCAECGKPLAAPVVIRIDFDGAGVGMATERVEPPARKRRPRK